jgi:hypothetical protein
VDSFQQNDEIIPQRTSRRLRPEEVNVTNVLELNRRTLFDSATKDKIGNSIYLQEK